MGPKKKRKSKKQLKEEEMLAERLKKEEAEQRAREEEARLKELLRQRQEAKVKAKIESMEQNVRSLILTQICCLFSRIRLHDFLVKVEQREDEEWARYLLCDRLPFPESAPVMHTHLFLWQKDEETDMDKVLEKAEVVLKIIHLLDHMIEEPLNAKPQTIANWKEIRESYRFELTNKINLSTFHLLRDIEERFNRIDFWTVDYKKSTENIILSMWGWLVQPVSELDKRDPPSIDFPQCGVFVKLPVPYNKTFVILRTIRTLYDHYSDTSRSWDSPQPRLHYDLGQIVTDWYNERENLRRDQEFIEAEKKRIEELQRIEVESVTNTETSVTTSDEGDVKMDVETLMEEVKTPSPEPLNLISLPQRDFEEFLPNLLESSFSPSTGLVPAPTDPPFNDDFLSLLCPGEPSTLPDLIKTFDKAAAEDEKRQEETESIKKVLEKLFGLTIPDEIPGAAQILQTLIKDPDEVMVSKEKSKWNDYIISMETSVGEFELNLRKHVVLGGVYHVELIKHVPQASKLKYGPVVQVQYGEYNVEKENFFFIYEPPKVTESVEEDEEKPPPDDNIDRLVIVEVTLPQHVLWFEAPTIVLWDAEKKFWSNEHVYDVKFNEEKQLISCRLGKLDPIGLAAVRFNNLPFQTWELRPDWDDKESVVLSLTASTVILEFLIKGKLVALLCLQNATSGALESLLGQFFQPHELIEKMKNAGVDLFPCPDTFLYVEGNSIKAPELEEHVYLSMAMFSVAYQFTWSRWNLPSGKGKIVFQMREALSKKSLTNYQMVMVDQFRTVIVNCSEVSPAFSEVSIPGLGFYPDLYSLLSNVRSDEAAALLDNLSLDLVLTVYLMLLKTNVISFS